MRLDEKIPPRRLGRYILHERMARGGMAEVYRATLPGEGGFERAVAIKCIHPDLRGDRAVEERFVAEARTLAALHHANIVQVLELGRERDGTLFMAMELIEGRDLRDVLRRALAVGESLPLPLAAYVVSEVAKGLAYAHRAAGADGTPMGVVHRDVTPRNILVGFRGEVKVIDFGIAKGPGRGHCSDPAVWKGKLGYMAPEQLRCEEVDHRSDIYALGLVLFELATGRRLFERDTEDPSVVDLRALHHLDLDAQLPEGPAELRGALERCLAVEPADRYQRADLLLADLQPLMIQGRGLYGALDAAQLMERLYAHEMTEADVLFPTLVDLAEREEVTLPARPFSGQRRGARVPAAPIPPPRPRARTTRRSRPGARPSPALRAPGGTASVQVRPPAPPIARARPRDAVGRRPSARVRGSWPARIASRAAPALLAVLVGLGVVASWRMVAPTLRDPDHVWAEGGRALEGPPPARGSSEQDRGAQPDGHGFVTVEVTGEGTRAAARIFVDGELVGEAPLLAHRLPVGVHEIEAIVVGDRPRVAKTVVRVGPGHTRDQPLRRVLHLRAVDLPTLPPGATSDVRWDARSARSSGAQAPSVGSG